MSEGRKNTEHKKWKAKKAKTGKRKMRDVGVKITE